MNKKKIFALCISFALICVLVFFVYPTKASADEHMNLTRSERVSLAKAEYSEFLEKPSKKSEVLVTFNNATADEIINIMKNDVEVISAFHTFTAYGETAVGGYRECEGKTVKEVIVDYYNSIYNMLGATISNYEDNREAADNADSESEAETNPWTEKMSEEYERFVLQKEAMEAGGFMVSGMRIIAENSVISKLTESEKVYLIEKLDFDNNDIITPVILEEGGMIK